MFKKMTLKKPGMFALAAFCLFVLTAMIPVAGAGGGNGTVTMTISPPEGDTYYLGDMVTFSGTNTVSDTTYLFIAGFNIDRNGGQILEEWPSNNPVVDGDASTFKAVSVGPDGRWSWSWDTDATVVWEKTYTIYAAAAPRDMSHLEETAYASQQMPIQYPSVSVTVSPQDAAPGDIVTISGTATANPASGVAIWLIGPDYSDRFVVSPDSQGSYSLDLDTSAVSPLYEGTYHVIVQHPFADHTFNFVPEGDYLYNDRRSQPVCAFRGPDRLKGDALYDLVTRQFSEVPCPFDVIKTGSFTMSGIPVPTPTMENPSVLSFGPATGEVQEGSHTTYTVALDSIPNGLAGFKMTVNVENPDIATIVGVTMPDTPVPDSFTTIGPLPSDNVLVKRAVSLPVDSGSRQLFSVTLQGISPGTTRITLTTGRVDDRYGTLIPLIIEPAELTVTGSPEPVSSPSEPEPEITVTASPTGTTTSSATVTTTIPTVTAPSSATVSATASPVETATAAAADDAAPTDAATTSAGYEPAVTPAATTPPDGSAGETLGQRDRQIEEQNRILESQRQLIDEQNKEIEKQRNLLDQLLAIIRSITGGS